MKRFGAASPLWLKVAAALGFVVSLSGAFYTVFPIIAVQSRFWFAAKILAVVLIANGVGVLIYVVDQKRRLPQP
jgi:hypothetical protein